HIYSYIIHSKPQPNSKIAALLKNGRIEYTCLDGVKSSVEYDVFEANYDLLAAVELPNIRQYTYYYQSQMNISMIMCLKIYQDDMSAVLANYDYFKLRLHPILQG
ncbi:hypothetical protein, partial [Pontibacter harenae]|uniref:hypothetical protein n=1 Tax=Pontibacter harenae TaxID=2894083 RepID=UPI001E54DC9C